jgi:hypothetical protein
MEIWVSSVKHLTIFYSIVTSTPLWRKFIGQYKMPKEFPRINLYSFIGMPIVLFSKGQITLGEKSLKYNAFQERSGFLKSYSNLKDDLVFEIDYSDIQSIDRYRHENAFINYYNAIWIRIVPKTNILDKDILICVGGNGPFMSGITYNTDSLFEIIMQRVQLVNATNK